MNVGHEHCSRAELLEQDEANVCAFHSQNHRIISVHEIVKSARGPYEAMKQLLTSLPKFPKNNFHHQQQQFWTVWQSNPSRLAVSSEMRLATVVYVRVMLNEMCAVFVVSH